MKFKKCLLLALNILFHSKLRSWLTIIGIVIGVAAVVAIVSIGEGLQQNVQNRLSGLGADIITISPGKERAGGGGFGHFMDTSGAISSNAKNLTKQDIQSLKGLDNIASMEGVVSGRADVYYLDEKTSLSIDGVDPIAWQQISTSELDVGRFLGPSDYAAVVVGGRIANNTFKEELPVNRALTIQGTNFKIVGILKQSGGGDDRTIIMPQKAAINTLSTVADSNVGTNSFTEIIVKASSPDAVTTLTQDIDDRLMNTRHVNARTKDYRVTSSLQTQQRISGVTQTLTIFLTAIAAVSLVVGAVGIANTLFTSVLEKTKEIGIMKAIGAQNKDILLIFLLNAGLVGLVGGIIGVILGVSISSLIPSLGFSLGGIGGPGGGKLTTSINVNLLILALCLAVGIGMIAGVIPAYRASKLKPADALRYQ